MNDTIDTPNSARTPIEAALDPLVRYLATSGRQLLAAAMVLAAVVLVAYSNTVSSGLQSDERAHVQKSVEDSGAPGPTPTGALVLGVESRVFGPSAVGYRISSLAWHFLAALALYFIVRRLAPDGAYGWLAATLAAAIFAAHPAGTHAVNALTARAELAGSALALVGVALMLSVVGASRAESQWRRAAMSWIAVGAGCAANPAAALAAPILPALEYASRRRVTWPVHGPAIALVVLMTLVRGLMQTADAQAVASPPSRFTLAAIDAALAPVRLLVYHAPAQPQWGNWIWLGLLAAGIAAFAVRPAIGVGVLWFALAIRLARPGASFDEAEMYLALAGVAVLVVCVLSMPRAWLLRVAVVLPAAVALLGAIALTSTRNNVWRSEAAVWVQAYDACPRCAVPADRLGRLHYEQATRDLAAAGAVQELPEEVRGHLELAVKMLRIANHFGGLTAERALIRFNALRLLGRDDAADVQLNEAAARFPTNGALQVARVESTTDPGTIGRASALRAVRGYRAAAERGAVPADSRARYARALAFAGQWREASAALRGMDVEADPALSALAAEAAGRVQAAQAAQGAYFQTAQRLGPADRSALAATILVAEGHYQLAGELARATLAQYPSATRAWLVAGLADWYAGELTRFIESGVPAAFAADTGARWEDLARFLAQSSELAAAERVFRDALGLSEFDAVMRMAAMASELRRATVAMSLLRRAAGIEPENPAPWLSLAELAIAAQQGDVAREAIDGAEQRGADAEAIAVLKARAGISATDTQGLRRTIIR